MPENDVKQYEPNYYSSYLRGVLYRAHDERMHDDDFINERAEQASAECETQRLNGASFECAQERAMHVLLDGLGLD